MMNPVVLNAVIDENRHLIVDIPDDIPPGPVQIMLLPTPETEVPTEPQKPLEFGNLTREEVRARLLKAGMLSTARYAPDDAEELSPEERERIGKLFAGPRPVEDYINEDREERF